MDILKRWKEVYEEVLKTVTMTRYSNPQDQTNPHGADGITKSKCAEIATKILWIEGKNNG